MKKISLNKKKINVSFSKQWSHLSPFVEMEFIFFPFMIAVLLFCSKEWLMWCLRAPALWTRAAWGWGLPVQAVHGKDGITVPGVVGRRPPGALGRSQQSQELGKPQQRGQDCAWGVPDRCSLSACYCSMAPLSNDEAIRAPTMKNVISCFLFLIFSFLILLGGSLKSRLR